jgi:hypothetical protein
MCKEFVIDIVTSLQPLQFVKPVANITSSVSFRERLFQNVKLRQKLFWWMCADINDPLFYQMNMGDNFEYRTPTLAHHLRP